MDLSTCAICLNAFGTEKLPITGPSLSDIPTTCRHFFCPDCWVKHGHHKLSTGDLVKCPACRRDVTVWWCCTFPDEIPQALTEVEEEEEPLLPHHIREQAIHREGTIRQYILIDLPWS